MKIIIDIDENCAETEIRVRCASASGDIEKLVAAIRMLDTKLAGRRDGKRHVIDAAEVLYVESVDKRAFIYARDGAYESHFNLRELEARLEGRDFLRASKSCLFNINHVQAIEPDIDRRLILTMEKGIKIIVSRQYSAEVRQKLEANNG